MVLKEIFFKIKKGDGANLRANSGERKYQMYVFRKDSAALYGSFTCFEGNSGWGHYYHTDSGIGAEGRLVDELNGYAGEDLNKLDWKPRRPIT